MEEINLIKQGVVDLVPLEDLERKFKRFHKTKKPLRVKLGIDPSAPHLHLGHYVVLRKLRQFQDLGHLAILVVGDFTRRIGDPSGRTKAREMMTEEEIKKNMKDYEKQAFKILDPCRTEIRYNSQWLGKLSFADIIKLTSKYTVARMLEREDFSKRFKENMPITIMEFLYPLAQAYDSVAISADVELGGLDQKFNLLIGRDIQREYGQEPQVIITVPLLIGVDGKWAMSQSRGNYIGITEPPYEMYGKVMSIPDEIVKQYFELLTEVPWDEVKAFHPKDCKARLAWEIVRFFHGGKKADEAKEEFERVFSRGERPSEVERVFINPGLIKKDGTIWIVDLLSGSSSVKSRSEAKRLIEQGAVWVSGKRIKSVDCDLPFEEGMLLRVGKRRFVEVFIEKG